MQLQVIAIQLRFCLLFVELMVPFFIFIIHGSIFYLFYLIYFDRWLKNSQRISAMDGDAAVMKRNEFQMMMA